MGFFRDILKDSANRTTGSTERVGTREVARDANNRTLGHYDSKTDRTYDANNRVVGTGNQTGKLYK